jgi:hypothetical protein
VQPYMILWSDIDEYLCDRDPRGNLSIRIKLKSSNKKLRYSPRSAFEKSRKPFDAFALNLTETINQINNVVDARVPSQSVTTNSMLDSASVPTAPKIRKGISFYDRPIAKVIAVVFGVLYALGMIGMLFADHSKPFSYRLIYPGVLIGLFIARVFGRGYKK